MNVNKVFLIAEAGVNHNGSLETAIELIQVASNLGIDAIKFQTYKTKDIILPNVNKAKYQQATTNPNETMSNMLQHLEIDEYFHKILVEECIKRNIMFLSTPYDYQSLELLVKLKVPMIKVASTDTTNLLFLERVAKTHLPVLFSTGMSFLSEVEKAYYTLVNNGSGPITILKCTSNYPTPMNEINLKGLLTLKNAFPDATIGFSDHTAGVGASPYAVSLGATVVEKHFTLNKNMEGPDHKASLDPNELAKWVSEIRLVESMMGDGIIKPSPSEADTKTSLQKYLVSKRPIKNKEMFTAENIIAKRTGGEGIKADFAYELIGKRANMSIKENEILRWQYVS